MTIEMKADALFRPARSKAESKHDMTDSAARSIIGAEVARREAKTERLRRARLAMEEAAAAEEKPAAKKKPRKAKA